MARATSDSGSRKRKPIRPGAPGTKMIKNEVPFGGLSKAAVRLGMRAVGQAVNKSAGGKRVVTRAVDSTRGVRNPIPAGKLPIKARRTTTGQGRKKVSSIEARRIAEQAAGPKAKSPTGRVPSKVMGQKTGPVIRKDNKGFTVSTPKNRGGKTKTNSAVTKSYQTNRVTPKDRQEAMRQERLKRITELLTPLKSRGTASAGKVVFGPKPNSRTVLVAKPGKATDANKLITAPRGRMGDPAKGDVPKQIESRRVALRNAASDSRNASQPSNKSSVKRELEQRPDTNRVSAPKPKDPAQREADKRVAEGLKKANQGKKARPEMPKTKARAPKYPSSTTARFRRQTGGE